MSTLEQQMERSRRRNRTHAHALAIKAGMPRAAYRGLHTATAGYILETESIELHETDLRPYGGKVRKSWIVVVGASHAVWVIGPRGRARCSGRSDRLGR